MSDAPAIVLDRVTKHYGSGPGAVAAVVDVNLQVPSGEFVSVIGPSGSGKSTLLNLIAGLDTPTSGRVIVAGHDLAGLSQDERSDLRLQSIGIIFQGYNLFPEFTVEENVTCPLEFLGVRWREARRRAGEALQRVGIPGAAWNRTPLELSGGEQQRIAIARALATRPKLLLADEPTGNLDSHNGKVVLDLLRHLNVAEELTVVLVTHSAFAASYGPRTIELGDGRVVRDVRAPREPSSRVVPLRS